MMKESNVLIEDLLPPVKLIDDFGVMAAPADRVAIMGVEIADLSQVEAMHLMEDLIRAPRVRSHAIFIVNAHTLNLAAEDAEYRRVLNSAYRVFGDGTGVRWAASYRGVRLKDNLVGTDLVPRFFHETAGRGYSYFLLGANQDTIGRAAQKAAESFPGWEQAGYHHGYVHGRDAEVIQQINDSGADMLLVGMGNPLQEKWIARYLDELHVPVCVGVGGLFDHWAGNIQRAPRWVRSLGYEWLQLLLQQPHKWRRYLIGNPKFLLRMIRAARHESRHEDRLAEAMA
jgi:N-acetylglucosaminyldiphosphoundecaprenol N-acetyl-beta-D-mannosaminyltransferase